MRKKSDFLRSDFYQTSPTFQQRPITGPDCFSWKSHERIVFPSTIWLFDRSDFKILMDFRGFRYFLLLGRPISACNTTRKFSQSIYTGDDSFPLHLHCYCAKSYRLTPSQTNRNLNFTLAHLASFLQKYHPDQDDKPTSHCRLVVLVYY